MNKLFRVQSSKFGGRNLEPGTWNTEHAAAAWVLSTVLVLLPAAALAQALKDPTRPPIGYAGDDYETGEVATGPVLQSVMISPTRKSAIINGEVVRLGARYGNAVLVKIAEHEVVLRSGEDTQVLKMYPGVEKREHAPDRGKARGGAEDAAKGDTAPR